MTDETAPAPAPAPEPQDRMRSVVTGLAQFEEAAAEHGIDVFSLLASVAKDKYGVTISRPAPEEIDG